MAQTLGFMLFVLGLVACVLGLDSQVLGLGLGLLAYVLALAICVLDSITADHGDSSRQQQLITTCLYRLNILTVCHVIKN